MRYNNVELIVKIKGREITEYAHNGQVFIEGRKGSEFEIAVKNNNPFRVEAVISVDGLSVIDGKEAGPASDGYVLEAHASTTIPGWMLTNAQVAKFEFGGTGGGRGATYAEQSTGSTRNVGVIGLLVYREEARMRHYTGYGYAGGPVQTYLSAQTQAMGLPRALNLSAGSDKSFLTGTATDGWLGSESFGVGTCSVNNTLGALDASAILGINNVTLTGSNAMASGPAMGATYSTSGVAAGMRSRGAEKSRGIGGSSLRSMKSKSVDRDWLEQEQEQSVQNIGTKFGHAAEFATEHVSFARGDLHAMLVLNYDDARGLRSRGIDLSRRSKALPAPNAFPGFGGCTPPKGWRG